MPTYTSAFPNRPFNLVLTANVTSQSQANNTSTVSWTIDIVKTAFSPTWSNSTSSWSRNIGGESGSGNFTYDFRNSDSLRLNSGSRTITHNSAGNLTVFVSARGDVDILGSTTASGSFAAPRIPKAPSAPGTPTATASTTVERRVALHSWSTPTDDGGASITGYRIYDATSGSQIATTTGTSATLDLAAYYLGLNRRFRVAAVNSVGVGPQSSNSNEVLINGNPTAPRSPSATASTSVANRISLSWTAPATSPTSVTQYRVYVATSSGGPYDSVQTVTGTSANVNNVATNATRFFRITARNAFSINNGTESAASSTVSATALGLPAAPAAPSVTASTTVSQRVSVSWSAPNNGGSAITGYRIYNAANDSLLLTTTGTGTSASVDLANSFLGTNMRFKVAAINTFGTGPLSSQSNQVLINGVPTAPSGLSGATSQTTAGSITASWTAPATTPTAITGYSVYARRTDVSGSRTLVLKTSGTGTSGTITGLVPNGVYTIDVAARNAFADSNNTTSAPSGTISRTAAGPPGVPRTVTLFITNTSSQTIFNRVRLTWAAPLSLGNPGTDISYLISWYRTSNPGTVFTATTSSLTYTTPQNLLSATQYSFTVTARNGLVTGNAGPASAITSITTAAPTKWIDSSLSNDIRVGIPYSDGVLREPAAGITYVYSVFEGSLPPGLSLNSSTGAVTGTPTAQGEYEFTIRAITNTSTDPIFTSITLNVRPGGRIKKGSATPLTIMRRLENGVWTDIFSAKRRSGGTFIDTSMPSS
jgi:large repetitive protein